MTCPQVAELHAAQDLRLRSPGLQPPLYRCCTVEQLAEEQPRSFDAVVASEVLEHVDSQSLFLDMCCQLLRVSTASSSCGFHVGGIVAFTYLDMQRDPK